ncbi:class I SAM-dependent methyltransferase [Allokutzneria oryzae]|uniref:Class I SAM-dependent methyltransferase n=1 Tax=Allokutzneria oryzae TaxID=1378989 RepID=A0ABV5ZRA4_9PSEU
MTTTEIRKGWRTPAVFYRLISSSVLRAVLGWDFPAHNLRQWVEPGTGTTCVEIGSGGGFYTRPLRAHLGEKNTLVALDPAASSMMALREKLSTVDGASMLYLGGDGCKLPFASDSIDTMFYGYSLEEVPDPLAALTEAHRVLKPGGQLVVFLWRPVIMRSRRAPVQRLLDEMFTRHVVRRGPQNIRLSYRKP